MLDRRETHQVASRDEWLQARRELLRKEKELTRLRDRISAERRALPWVRVEKDYVFDTPAGSQTLAELFDGRSQLIVYHFMLGPDWEQGCIGCSFLCDHVDGANQHLKQHDVTFVAVSRAPLAKIEAYKKRMGWSFPWVSSFGTDFNFDFHVSFAADELAKGKVYYNFEMVDASGDELSGRSVFCRNAAGDIFHTYSSYARGGDEFVTTYNYLDITPKGRNESGPRHNLMDWVKRRDEYEAVAKRGACCA